MLKIIKAFYIKEYFRETIHINLLVNFDLFTVFQMQHKTTLWNIENLSNYNMQDKYAKHSTNFSIPLTFFFSLIHMILNIVFISQDILINQQNLHFHI